MKQEKKLIQAWLTPKLVEMISEIMEEKGYSTKAFVFQQSIIDLHASIFKDYIYKKKNGEEKLIIKRTKQEEIFEKGNKICDLLGGQAYQDEAGHWYCKYFNYDYKKRNEQEVPFPMLTDDLARNQYFPSKEKVLQLQKDKKTEY